MHRISLRLALAFMALITALSSSLPAASTQLGDVDADGIATVRDIARIVGHIKGTRPLSGDAKTLADVNGDGAVNQTDIDLLIDEILETREPESLPLSTVRFSSPSNGEGDVAVTRETIVHFTVPLALETTLDTSQFYAEFGGKKILSRAEVSGDRMKATLFYLEPLPSNARIRVTLDGSGLTDLVGRSFDADGDGESGGVFQSNFDTLTITRVGNTSISGRVFASRPTTSSGGNTMDVPLAGVTVTVDGAEETLRAVTDGMGNFTLPCPAGTFFVHIDGRTSPSSDFPAGGYYPFVGKKWFARAGRTDNLAGDQNDTPTGPTGTVYLPFVCPGTLQPVSQTEETSISFPEDVLTEFPELAGTQLMVPANSLFANDGTRGGSIGIAPVAPDRLPGPLPLGLNPALVITIQTDGSTNFDQPVPIRLPNTPDPETGQALPPGAKSALTSFDHDSGEWQVVGSMTVSQDGKWVISDPGVGIRQPGWHVQQSSTQITSYRQITGKNGRVVTVVKFSDGTRNVEKGNISRRSALETKIENDANLRKTEADRGLYDRLNLLLKQKIRPSPSLPTKGRTRIKHDPTIALGVRG